MRWGRRTRRRRPRPSNHEDDASSSADLLRAGDANLRLWRKPELDPSYGESALAIYQELAGRYPGTDAAARAQVHVQQLREWFAQKDYKNGLFYFRRRAFDSAIIYFKDVIANYQGTARVRPGGSPPSARPPWPMVPAPSSGPRGGSSPWPATRGSPSSGSS